MAYKMFINGVLMPITPAKVKVKIKNQNKTLNLINGEEINILKEAGLSEVSFDVVLPQTSYPYTNGTAQSVQYYLSLFESLKASKQPFQWILNRSRPNGRSLFFTNIKVGLEDYQIVDDANEGFDVTVSIKLKQFRPFGTKTITLPPAPEPTEESTKEQTETVVAVVADPPRETTSAPTPQTYTVKSGDCLWNIARKYLGDGSRYPEIYELNKSTIDAHNGGPNMIWTGDVLILPDP